MSARRPLLTATAAGATLFALWFVPSANATVEDGKTARASQAAAQAPSAARASSGARAGSEELSLADTGGVDTTPYLYGGTAFLVLGTALVGFAVHRTRTSAG
ncbi:hypothetical protein ACH429_15840 [Streptomyces pathocidini]|uniref:Uncharacterized protein n=1 Tax=Streptomyces pathocidini TaxID=1650571 RepID=A0ABW7USH1_9ACTN|nr:hypothetical protein [Streptomyces pathocidini]